MAGKTLSDVGASLVRRFGTRDPFQIAKSLGINVLFCSVRTSALLRECTVLSSVTALYSLTGILMKKCHGSSVPMSLGMTSFTGTLPRPIVCMNSCFMI